MSDKLALNTKVSDNHHTHVWTSGTQGGGKVPADFSWNTNPKQTQEESGTNVVSTEVKPTK